LNDISSRPSFGIYVEGKPSKLVLTNLVVTEYAKSPETDAHYPSARQYTVKSDDGMIDLEVRN
jgi:hypothetical protein